MNRYQLDLFNALEALVASGTTFYRQEFVVDGLRYWIYNYRLASYTEFERPAGRECRGHMFEVDNEGKALRLASLPMQKFHNLNECPLTMNLDLSKVDIVELKADGSLMSTFIHDGKLRFKSKGSLFSEQALDAIEWIQHEHRYNFRVALTAIEHMDYTVNLEWCAPHNRIVIGYEKAHLKVLNARNRLTGEYLERQVLEDMIGKQNVIDRVNTDGLDTATFVQQIPAMQDDIEGYVCRIGDLWFKVKTEKYMSLHHAKDSVNNPRRLFEAVVDEGVDDLRSMFAHDAAAMVLINDMQEKATTIYNTIVQTVEQYHQQNHALDRKSYAIGAQQLKFKSIGLLGPAMTLYLGNTPDYKSLVKAKYKELGFKDEAKVTE